MKILLLALVTCLSFSTPAYSQVKPGDGPAPIKTGAVENTTKQSKDSMTIISDISVAYSTMEENIELLYDKLIKQGRNNIDALNDKIKKLNDQIENVKEEIEKIKDQIAKMEKIVQQLNQDKMKGISSLQQQKQNALSQAIQLIKQKRWQEAQTHTQKTKTITEKASDDSLRLIRNRYPVLL